MEPIQLGKEEIWNKYNPLFSTKKQNSYYISIIHLDH